MAGPVTLPGELKGLPDAVIDANIVVTVCCSTVPCYSLAMTKLLDDALTAVRNLSPDEQDHIARAMLRLTGADDEAPVALSADECAAIAASKSAAARGEFASDEQVRAAWAKHGL